MNCWKSVNITKEFGLSRLYLVSFLTGLLAFIFLYVSFSILQGDIHVHESGIVPLIMMNKSVKFIYKTKNKKLPVFTYYTKSQLTKKVSLMVALAPTILITIPGIAASYMVADFYVYILLFTSVHIGISFIDFL